MRESILRGLGKRTRALNFFPLLFAADHGLDKLGVVIESWRDISREMILEQCCVKSRCVSIVKSGRNLWELKESSLRMEKRFNGRWLLYERSTGNIRMLLPFYIYSAFSYFAKRIVFLYRLSYLLSASSTSNGF